MRYKNSQIADLPGREKVYKRGKNVKKRWAREIVRRLLWIEQPLIYWTGVSPEIRFHKSAAFRPIVQLIAEQLLGSPPGLYVVKTEYSSALPNAKAPLEDVRKLVNPAVTAISQVTSKWIAEAAHALKASEKYPKALPKLIGDVVSWRSIVGSKINAASFVLKEVSDLPLRKAESLAIEERCLWVGPDENRPSRILSTEMIKGWLKDERSESKIGKRLAAIVLGQRRVSIQILRDLEIWRECGLLLSNWPPDLLSKIQDPAQLCRQIVSTKETQAVINSEEGAIVALELIYASTQDNLTNMLAALRGLFSSCENALDETSNRLSILKSLVKETLSIVPAFLHDEISMKDKWHTVGWFCLTFEYLLQSYLRSAQIKKLDDESKLISYQETRWPRDIRYSWRIFEEACSNFLGVEFHLPLKELTGQTENRIAETNKQILNRLALTVDTIPLQERRAWKMTFAGLGARAVTRGSPSGISSEISSWVNHCSQEIEPGQKSESAIKAAAFSLEYWIGHSGWSPNNLTVLAKLLDKKGIELLKQGSLSFSTETSPSRKLTESRFSPNNWERKLREELWIISRLGALTSDEAECIVRNDLYGEVMILLNSRPDALRDFIRLMTQPDNFWLVLKYQNDWARIFAKHPVALVLQLEKWMRSQMNCYRFSLREFRDILQTITDIIGRSNMEISFVTENFWIWDKILQATSVCLNTATPKTGSRAPSPGEVFFDRAGIAAFAAQWVQQDYPNPQSVVEKLLERCARLDEKAILKKTDSPPKYFESIDEDYISGIVRIAGGNISRLENLLNYRCSAAGWTYPENPNNGWAFLKDQTDVQEFLRPSLDHKELISRVIKFLQHVALAVRLQKRKELKASFCRWRDPEKQINLELPVAIPPATRENLEEIATYRKLADEPILLPGALTDILRRKDLLQQEIQDLGKMKQDGQLSKSAAIRLEKLLKYQEKPDLLTPWILKDLRQKITKQLREAKMGTLERLAAQEIQGYFQDLFPGARVKWNDNDWENALRLYLETQRNKAMLKKLLRQEAHIDHEWVINHPMNQMFINKIRAMGVDFDVWHGEMQKHFLINGDTWTINAETNPLRVLQMGNLFDTCLSTGESNAFSTIANAIEVNKRVLYIRNGRGNIIGRKLIGLVPEIGPSGQRVVLIGFYSYGASTLYRRGEYEMSGSPWVKILFDVLCLEIAQRIGAHFETHYETLVNLSTRLPLFAKWYNDGPEPSDWWIADPQVNAGVLGYGDRNELISEVSKRLSEKRDWSEAIRALLWLGDDASSILQKLGKSAFDSKDLDYIGKHTQSNAVRELTTSWLT
jgi:hypothetical protein